MQYMYKFLVRNTATSALMDAHAPCSQTHPIFHPLLVLALTCASNIQRRSH